MCDYKLHYNDTFITNGLISIPTTGKVPDGRTWHSLSAVSDKHLFLYGGFNNQGEALGETLENFKLKKQNFFFNATCSALLKFGLLVDFRTTLI